MDKIPQLRLAFVLTKSDSTDFDRDAVTQRLCITPTETKAPRRSKGLLNCDDDFRDIEKDFSGSGMTILPAASSPYQILLHAYWCVELPKIESWSLDEVLQQLERIFCGKQSDVQQVCKDYNLTADLIVRVYAEANSMPILEMPHGSVSFWASMGVSIGFDFYLD